MLDIKFIRQNPDLIKQAAQRKRIDADVDRLLAVDSRRVELITRTQELQELRNRTNDQIKKAAAEEKGKLIAQMKEVSGQIKDLEAEMRGVQEEFDRLLLTMPMPPAPEVPDGKDDTENVEVRKWGEVPKFDFAPKDHVDLGAALDIIDIPRGAKLSGSRFYYLKGDGAMLEWAVLQFTLNHMTKKGFVPMIVPVLAREHAMTGTAYFPGGEEQAYTVEKDELFLVGTAEVSLTAYHYDEILTEAELPKMYVALSPCFRREAGAAGKDTRGLYRIHQFQKVEQVIVCRNDEDESRRMHEFITRNSEEVVQALGLPYRVVNVCTGDLGRGQVQKFDIECWMPSRGGYGETHSASRFYDFQARRLKLRYRDKDGKTQFCHTLNNTVIASPRILIPLLENYQQADGSVVIPEALRPYMGGRERIVPRGA
ncbi:MAG TPA: serine--tRNA ligase [Candidatus Brocadiia bacterium]|nr:serine--tRNA ligase [Candidatus Brocadiia bacterium]